MDMPSMQHFGPSSLLPPGMHSVPSYQGRQPYVHSQLPTVPISQQQQQQQQQQLVHQRQQNSPVDQTDRARAYKSRNKRPCDFCRYKKAACHLESRPPCELCIRYNKECTFVESPAKRRRPNENRPSTDLGVSIEAQFDRGVPIQPLHGAQSTFVHGSMTTDAELQPDYSRWDHSIPGFHMAHLPTSPPMPSEFGHFDSTLYQEVPPQMHIEAFGSSSNATTSPDPLMNQQMGHRRHTSLGISSSSKSVAPSSHYPPYDLTSADSSLDNQAQCNSQIVGMSGDIDPYLVSRFRFDERNEAYLQPIRVRKMNNAQLDSSGLPTFFHISHNALASRAQPPETMDALDGHRRDVDEMVSQDVGRRLIRLFYRYVQPYFPVLTRDGGLERDSDGIRDPSTIPTCILAAIYGHALAFCAWDEKLCIEVYTPPSADALFHIAWLACLPLLHTPSLAVLQTLLLLVQRRPTNKHVSDTPFKWTMMTTAVGIAQVLGINRDPSTWPIPPWEIKVRKRLAWATYIQDKWIALNFGRSSHIQDDDWDLVTLHDDDFVDDEHFRPLTTQIRPFVQLCELTQIVDQIAHRLFSLRAARMLHDDLTTIIETARPLQQRLSEWHSSSLAHGSIVLKSGQRISPDHQQVVATQHELDGTGSLRLAYLTAKMQVFRALLRPRKIDASHPAVVSLRSDALGTAREVLEFLEGLNARELEAFWASYSRTNFSVASNFMLLLFATAPTKRDATEGLSVLNSWRGLLRVKSRSCDMLNLALLRLDSAYVYGVDRLIELTPWAAQAWAESGSKS